MKERNSIKSRRTGVLNIALLFGTAAIALTLIVTPMLASRTTVAQFATVTVPDAYDDIKTGSITPSSQALEKPETENGKRYVIRRSILQKSPGSVCIVEGYKSGPGC